MIHMRSRAVALGALLALPLAGLALLLAVPELDVVWMHPPSHFWLVLGVAVVNVVLGALTSEAASRRSDPRLFLVSLALLSSAGFLGLHALATPGVVLAEKNAGFVVATPIGLLLASVFAAGSALDLDSPGARLLTRSPRGLRLALAAVLLAWAAASVAGVPPLNRPPPEEAPLPIALLTPLALGLYTFAAMRYAELYRRRRRTLPLAVAVAFVLLAEAMVAVAFGRSWHATWWEWHVLMAIAFGAIVIAAQVEYRREHSFSSAFGGLYLERTLERIDRRYSDSLARMVEAIRGDEPLAPILDELRREGFSGEEIALTERSARELSRIDRLFRGYVGPTLAERLQRDPELARLGGMELEVTVLFADLAGFTTFSEGRSPADVVDMLNGYWETVVPIVVEHERGLIERFAGDAILVVFNALGDQPDHAVRAARAALAVQERTERAASSHPGWPHFRIGINTGRAVMGNVGAGEQRSFTAIGDTTNVAARLQTAARPGQILAGPATYERVRGVVLAEPVGALELKGKAAPVEAYALTVLRS